MFKYCYYCYFPIMTFCSYISMPPDTNKRKYYHSSCYFKSNN